MVELGTGKRVGKREKSALSDERAGKTKDHETLGSW